MNIKTKASKNEYLVTYKENNETQFVFEGKSYDLQILNESEKTFTLRSTKGKKYVIDLVEYIKDKKIIKAFVNGKLFEYKIDNDLDILLREMGMNGKENNDVKSIIAPMPGLVLDILINEGDQVIEGQNLLILEAMKMENIIKSQSNAFVKSINISKSDSVDKGEILIELE